MNNESLDSQIDAKRLFKDVANETGVNFYNYDGITNINNLTGDLNIFLDNKSTEEENIKSVMIGLINLIKPTCGSSKQHKNEQENVMKSS